LIQRKELKMYQVAAFAGAPFTGNPAAVCLLEEWLPDRLLQNIAAENNLSETAFLVGNDSGYELRWFTPKVEVDLCGHATLASAHIIFEALSPGRDLSSVCFQTRSGELWVERRDDMLMMDFPAMPPSECQPPLGLTDALGLAPAVTARVKGFLLCMYDSARQVTCLRPDFAALGRIEADLVIVTAMGDSHNHDFISRAFAPRLGVDEDPVTGSAHCALVPYWSARLGKDRLRAFQASRRGGELYCALDGDRVSIGGRAVTYLVGRIFVCC
jgi:PhzF family phenazine biosynthesis protein